MDQKKMSSPAKSASNSKRVSAPHFGSHLIFGVLFTAFLFLPGIYFLFFYTPRAQSIAENRPLATFSLPAPADLANGKFMTDFEKALSDQMPLRTEMVTSFRTLSRTLSTASSAFLPKTDEGRVLAFLPGNIVLFESERGKTLLQEPFTYDQDVADDIGLEAQKFSEIHAALPKARLFVMDIEPIFLSAASPLNSLYPSAVNGRYSDVLKENLPNFVTSLSLRTEDFAEAERIYYRTDHHLNGIGAAKAYSLFYDALSKGVPSFGKAVDLSTIEEIPGTEMRGSKARSASYAEIAEPLTSAFPTLPDYTVTLDGQTLPRSHIAKVLSGEYKEQMTAEAAALSESVSPFLPYYAEVFGYDFGEVIYQNPDAKTSRTLLLVGPSYTQTFEQFLASHYRTVYVIDPRSYPDFAGKPFSVIDYAKEKNVSDIAYMIQPQYLADEVWQIR